MKCPKCDFDNPADSIYCSKCATRLDSAPQISVTKTLETPQETLSRGTLFAGRYEIIEALGIGGMGEVYRVEDKKIGQEVALKLIKPEIAAEKRTIERFRHELMAARMISHRNVCRMFDLGEDKGTHFITMEYVPGEDLKSFIRRSRQLSMETAIGIARQVCEGLAEAHRLGVVHRDLKPHNIMIDKEGNARIMDFGIARSVHTKSITGEGVIIGTPEYMSPEQAEAKEIDHRSDIYSLGIILYEMATGRVPFEGDTPLSIAIKQKEETPKDPRQFNPSIPDKLSGVILKCLKKDKVDRYQTAADVCSELDKIERGIPTTAQVGPRKKTLTSREITVKFTPRKLLIPGLMIISLAIAAFFAWRLLPRHQSAFSLAGRPSLAVLPFDDLSSQKDQVVFCQGLADSIINALTTIREIRVLARSSSFYFRNRDIGIQEIGRKFNVDAILEGSIQKAGDKLRVTAQLTKVDDNSLLWSGQYDEELKDIFAIQDKITLAIVDTMKVKLLADEKAKLARRPTENLDAYNLYLLGRYFFYKFTEADYRKAIEYFGQAIDKDPSYALAYVGQAMSYNNLCGEGYVSPDEAYPKAKAATIKALELDETLGEAHTSFGLLKMNFEWDIPGAEIEFRRALELSPNSAEVYTWHSIFLILSGRSDQAIIDCERAVELDPAMPMTSQKLGLAFYYAGRYDEAIAQCKKAIEMDSSYSYALQILACSYASKGAYPEAIAQADKVIAAWPTLDDPQILTNMGWVYAVSGRKEDARNLLNRLLELRARRYVDAYLLAVVYAGLGEKEESFGWLTRAYEEHAAQLVYLKMDPWLKDLRPDPRYKELLAKIGWEK